MKYRRFLLSLIVSLLAVSLAACAGSKEKEDDEQTQQTRLPAYFEEIPADTFFFVGGSEPVPPELVASTLSTFDALYQWGEELDDDLEEQLSPELAQDEPEEPEDLVDMLAREMGGEFSADGLAKLGISKSPRVAVYSVATVPVFRFELSDQKKFLAFVDRLEKKYEQPSAKLTHQKETYRRYDSPDDERYGLLRTTKDEAILATPDKKVFEIFLPYFVGAKKPKVSMADDNEFLRTVETNGFERFGAGYVNLEQMIAYSTGAEKPEGVVKAILDKSGGEKDKSAACKAEAMRLVKMMPKLVGGFRHYDENTTDFAFGAELEDGLARELAKTAVGAPGHDTAFAQKSLIEFGLGIDMGKMLDFLVAESRKIRNKPFQCEDFAEFNQHAGQLMGFSGQVPPAVRKLAGFNLLVRNVLLEWKPGKTKTGELLIIPRILGALRTEQPGALMYLVKKGIPEAKMLDPKPDGKPVAIPMPADTYEGIIEPLLLMTKRGLAVTVGPKMTDEAKGVLSAKEAATSPALVARLNLGDPAREFVDNMKTLVDKAEADKKARGLTDQEIAGARRAIATVEKILPEGPWAATFTTEFSEFGVLFAYRDQGALDFDFKDEFGEKSEADFEALGKVLGAPNPVKEANEDQARIEMGNIKSSLDIYYTRANPNSYPERLEQLAEEKILKEVPVDPWGQPYVYRRKAHNEYTLRCKGPDELEGTEDDIVVSSSDIQIGRGAGGMGTRGNP